MNGTTLEHDTTVEGPAHDPYHVDLWTVIRFGKEFFLRIGGLSSCYKIDGVVQDIDDHYLSAIEQFEDGTGLDFDRLQTYLHRLNSRCVCGCWKTKSESGFPGETFNVCVQCGEHVSYDFDMQAII